MDEQQRAVGIKKLRDDNVRLMKALAPFASDAMADECFASYGIVRSRANSLRIQAAEIERRDAEIQEARDALKECDSRNVAW